MENQHTAAGTEFVKNEAISPTNSMVHSGINDF